MEPIILFLLTGALYVAWRLVRARFHRRGDTYLRIGQFEAADRWYRHALRLNPRDPFAYHGLALAAWHRGEVEIALKHFDLVHRLKPEFMMAQFNHATMLVELKRYDEALHILEDTTSDDPLVARCMVLKAFIYLKRGDYDKSASIVAQIITEADQIARKSARHGAYMHGIDKYYENVSSYALRIRATLYLVNDRVEDALSDLDRALSINPESWAIRNDRGEVRFAGGKFQEALEDFKRSAQFTPELGSPLLPLRSQMLVTAGLAVTHHALGQIDEAQALWRDLTAENPRFRDLYWLKDELRWPQAMIDHAAQLDARVHQLTATSTPQEPTISAADPSASERS
jgi:tetratricopeptide (TPR) repeat protein